MRLLGRVLATLTVGSAIWMIYALLLELSLGALNPEHDEAGQQLFWIAHVATPVIPAGQAASAWMCGIVATIFLALFRSTRQHGSDGGVTPLLQVAAAAAIGLMACVGGWVVYHLGRSGALPAPYLFPQSPITDVALARADATAQAVSFFGFPLAWAGLTLWNMRERGYQTYAFWGAWLATTAGVVETLVSYWWCPTNQISHIPELASRPFVAGLVAGVAGGLAGFILDVRDSQSRLQDFIGWGLLLGGLTSIAAVTAYHFDWIPVATVRSCFGPELPLGSVPGGAATLAAWGSGLMAIPVMLVLLLRPRG